MSDAKSDKRSLKRNKAIRIMILVMVLAFSTALGILHQHSKSWIPVGVDALCPFGAIESAWMLFTTGTMIRRIAISSFILFGAILIVAFVFRRSFCGNICPLGTLQELAGRLGRIFIKKKLVVPERIDRPLRFLKYAVLFAVVVSSWITAGLVIRPFDPWAAWQHLSGDDLVAEFSGGLTVLALSLVLSFFFDRAFCKYLCPMGAFLGLFSKSGMFTVTRKRETCIDCKACDKACPVNITVQSLERVTTAECLACSECINSCPVRDTLYYEGPWKWKKRISAPLMFALTFVIYGAVVGSTALTGSFKLSLPSAEDKAKQSGAFDPESVTGRNTFTEISELSGIPPEAFRERFPIADGEWNVPLRNIVHKEGAAFSIDDIKAFLKEKYGRGR